MKKVISRYEVVVFDNGDLEFHPIVEDGDLRKCSNSMRQILSVIEYVIGYLEKNPRRNPNRNIHYAVTTAVNSVASFERVTPSTVHAKISRKLGLSMQEFRSQLNTCISSGAPENDILVERLISSCVARTKQADEEGVKQIIKKIQKLENIEY